MPIVILFLVALEQLDSKCPIPCKTMEYKGEMVGMTGYILLCCKFNTMDTEIHNNILIFDLATFIGTAGGSLGLFLAFSLTGFAEKILNFFHEEF